MLAVVVVPLRTCEMDRRPGALLSQWRDRLLELDRCPWPGPRPLGIRDQSLLIGRNDNRQEFLREIRQHRLVLLHGASGVGKTSLLQAGLVSDLDRLGSTVFNADQWGGAHGVDAREFLAEKLRLAGTGGRAFDLLDESLGDRAVLVLDQFEELVRYAPTTADKIFDVIIDLNRRLRIKIIISFRSEYLYELEELGARAVNFSFAYLQLRELADAAATKVIMSGNKGEGHDAVDRATAGWLATQWVDARTKTRDQLPLDDPFGRVGLLHLQAMLYTLYFANGKRMLTEDSILEILAAGHQGQDIDNPIDAQTFRFALQRAIDYKLDHCEAASRTEEDGRRWLDDCLIQGTRWRLGGTVTHLSSSGYKLIRGGQELARLALGNDYQALQIGLRKAHHGITQKQERALFETILACAHVGEGFDRELEDGQDLLSISRQDIAREADRRCIEPGEQIDSWSFRLDDGHSSTFANDPGDVTCGPMMGLTPADVFIEELRRFAFALVWLEASSLIRVTTPFGAGAMISLIHDGFGPALVRWAEGVNDSPPGPLNAITAPLGAAFGWSDGPAKVGGVPRLPAISGEHKELGCYFIPNLRWRGAWVQADLDRVAFLNCDLRGALFEGCRMSGVTFVNCLLDGAIFSDCIFAGRQDDVADDEAWSDMEPDFVVPAPSSLVGAHAEWRAMHGKVEAEFLCQLPGAPAVPYQGQPSSNRVRFPDVKRPVEERRLTVHLVSGGVAVYGGRISSLVVRKCYLEEASGLTLRHTTGSGLEIVEIEDSPGRFEIYGSAIRHVTLSAVVGARKEATVEVRAGQSALAQIWVGPRLRGSFTVTGSRLVHAWNGSPPNDDVDSGVRFIAVNCLVHGLLDVEVDSCTGMGDGQQTQRAADLGVTDLIDQIHRMDYRRYPSLAHQDHSVIP